MTPIPFTLDIPEADIEDLKTRLRRTRLPDQTPGAPWAYGTDLAYMRSLILWWRDQFDWVYREYEWAVFPLTIHPDVSGRPQVLLMLERLIQYINGHPGVHWCTMEEMAEEFRRRHPFKT